MKAESMIAIALSLVAGYYIFTARKEETQQEGQQARAETLTGRSLERNRERFQPVGHVFDWIDYQMMPGSGGGASRGKRQAL